MRKITTKQDQKKKQKRNQLIIAGIMVLLMFMSVFGIIVNSFDSSPESSSEREKYNGYTFNKVNGLWQTSYSDADLTFSNLPDETIQVQINNSLNTISAYSGEPLYLSSEDYYSTNEIYNTIYPFVSRMQFACLENATCQDETYPIKDCSENFIIIREALEPTITQSENCVFIEGPLEDLQKITDEFLYRTFRIKE